MVDLHVDSVLYPVAWYNTLRLLSAVPFHSAWARAMRFNLLAVNTHNTSVHMTGSSHPSRARWPLQSQEIFIDFQATFFFNNAFMSFSVTKLIIAWISVLTLFKEHYP